MSMKVAYQVQVGDLNGANFSVDANWLSISIDRSVFWDSPASAQIELDNHRGASRLVYAIGNTVKIYRNGVLLFYGVITKPKYWRDSKGHHASVELMDFYRWKLKTKITGVTEQWKFSKLLPSDLVKAMIGTQCLVQDLYDNTHRIDIMSDVAVQDGTMSLVKDASGYKATGYAKSTQLQNGDWDTMGDISAASVYVYPDTTYENLAPNPSFEDEMVKTITSGEDWTSTGWHAAFISSGHREITRSSAEHKTGSYSIRIYNDNSTPATNPDFLMWNRTPCEAGQTWKTVCNAKGSGRGIVYVGWIVGNTAYYEENIFTPGANWTEYSATKVLPSNAQWVWGGVCVDTGITSDVYFDDIYFGRVPASGDVDVSISRSDGAFYADAGMSYNATNSRWEGSVASFPELRTSFPASVIDYKYRKSHVITGTADGAQTNYQMLFTIYKGSGTDSAGTIYLNDLPLNWPYDIRFTNSTGTILDHYVSSSDSTSATVWVEIDSIPANPSTATIYVYFGNAAATDYSNIDNTFVFGDDFSTALDTTNKWEIDHGTATTSAGELTVTPTGSVAGLVHTKSAFAGNTAIIVKTLRSTSNAAAYFGYLLDSGVHSAKIRFDNGSNSYATITNNGSDNITTKGALTTTSYHIYEIRRNGTSAVQYLVDGSSVLNTSTQIPSDNLKFGFAPDYNAAINMKADYVLVRKYTVNEPTHGATGNLYCNQSLVVINKLKYMITLTKESLTSAPVVEGIEIHATTVSDTGITEGTIDTYTPPTGYESTMDKDFGDSTREDGIGSIQKVTGMEPIINIATGAINFRNIPAASSSGTLTVGTQLLTATSEADLLPVGNAIAYTGSGQISDNESFTHRVNLKDDTSIAAYGRIEKSLKGKDAMTVGVVNNRAYNALQNIKNPPRTITADLVDSRTTAIAIGSWYTVDDPSGVSGISNEVLRVMSESRKMDTGGESVSLTLSTLGYNPDQEAQFNNMMKSVEVYRDTAQAANADEVFPAVGNCKNSLPLKLFFYIKTDREVMNIELTANSEKYKDCQATDIVPFGFYAPCQMYINGDYSVLPCPTFGVQGDKNNPFSVKRLNLTNYYSFDGTNKLQPGWNTIYLVPSTVTTDNANGLLYINASIKVSYSS